MSKGTVPVEFQLVSFWKGPSAPNQADSVALGKDFSMIASSLQMTFSCDVQYIFKTHSMCLC